MSIDTSRTLYVGNLLGVDREKELEDLFYQYGPITHINLKVPPRPSGYVFVELKRLKMLKMLFVVVKAMILRNIVCGLNLHVVDMGVDRPDILNFVF